MLWSKYTRRSRIQTQEKAKVVGVVWGTYILECRNNHFATRMILTKVFRRTSVLIYSRCWSGMV